MPASISPAELHSVVSELPSAEIAEPAPAQSAASQRLAYRQEQSLSPQRSAWSRSLSRIRGSSRSRLWRAEKDSSPDAHSQSRSPAARWKPDEDLRARLPLLVSRFLGHRTAETEGKALFDWQDRLPRRLENSLLSCLGSFTSILAIESMNIESGLFHDWNGVPLIIASLGASAVLLFSTIDSPLSQPRNALGGQMLSALTAIIVNRLFRLNSNYSVVDPAPWDEFSRLNWLAAAISMSVALLVMELTGTVHPPGGATALICSVQPSAVALEWRFLLVIFASITVMIGIAMLFNNIGHRRYPVYYWSKPAEKKKPQPPAGANVPLQELDEAHEASADDAERRGRDSRPRNLR